ncbi:YciI family protein [Pseudoduganella sp. GCM10020061]|uniref:YciI family protein n=1 Tax=Pseudoduganella sp. GCM10020061 TaxID=3317345 RepID=UPI00363ECD9C
MWQKSALAVCMSLSCAMASAAAQTPPAAAPAAAYDAELAKSLGGDERGMRQYVLVILKTGPNKVADKDARAQMFKGHFANMERLAGEKKLVLAGPLDGVEGRRGIFVFNTPDIETAKTWVATDPVIINGEMVAEYHKFYGSAAVMAVNDIHNKIQKK